MITFYHSRRVEREDTAAIGKQQEQDIVVLDTWVSVHSELILVIHAINSKLRNSRMYQAAILSLGERVGISTQV